MCFDTMNFRRHRCIGKILLCMLLCSVMLFTACEHAWRIAANPNPYPVQTPEITPEPGSTQELIQPTGTQTPEPTAEDTQIPDTEPPVTGTPADNTETPAPSDSTAPTQTPAPSESSTPNESSTPTATPKPTATPAPTATPTPTPAPTPTPKPADIPPFSSPTINGHGTITNSIFSTGRVTMVNVWATTCGPCIQELPHIQQLANNYSSRGLKVITVLGDSEQPGMIQQGLNILSSIGVNLPVMRNNASVAAAFPAGAYPTTYFIDSNGNILRVEVQSHTYEEWCAIVNGLL